MNSLESFKMGDTMWEYLKSKRTRDWWAEEERKRADVGAEAREQEEVRNFGDETWWD